MKKATLFILTLIAATVLVAGDCQHGKAEAKKGDCCAWMKDAKFEVANTDNGVKLTVTAANAEAVKAVQEHFAMMAKEGFGAHAKAGCRLDDKAGCGHGHHGCCKKDGCKHDEKAGCKHDQKPGCTKPCCKDKKAVDTQKCPHVEEKAAEQPKS
jgi:hypothetical protein